MTCEIGAVLNVTEGDARAASLDLIRRKLTRYGIEEQMPPRWPLRRRLLLRTVNTLNPMLRRTSPFGHAKRDLGLDWPANAETMIGMQRLTSLQHCVETVLADDVPGDLVECGVWRGGASILMRAVLQAYGDETRCVWLADSFAGVPPPDPANYKADKGISLHRFAPILAVGSGSQGEFRALWVVG
jgi:O-methyltransferase